MNDKKLKLIFILSLLGVAFATTVTLRQFIAPTNEPGLLSCVGLSILGLSPCPYGLTLFAILAFVSCLMIYKGKDLLIWLKIFSLIGVIFSGWVVWREICLPAIQKGPVFWETFSLARVPACAWGFIVFLIVLILVLLLKSTAKQQKENS